MKLIQTFLIQTMCCAALLAAGQARAADLTIGVDDVKAGGTIQGALYDSAGGFMKTTVGTASIAAVKTANTVALKDLPAGEYALKGRPDNWWAAAITSTCSGRCRVVSATGEKDES
jgi:uncharacterized protein (DUF2141 family)